MPSKRMLIDAAHPEETRIASIDGDRLIDYDVEVASRRQLKGNIYLAKITRVEPSLQAAFVDYGGNRHGFLAFNEIHPDYYQIPVADREALIAEQAAAERAEEALAAAEEGSGANGVSADNGGEAGSPSAVAESVSGDLDDDDLEVRRPRMPLRHYKIQEVIKKRQIMLVQVTKEERGTKGAALTTYLSLAGRYCVLMPNTIRGGGISRKITSVVDRKRLKAILSDLSVPEGMAVILRTAGSERNRAEIRRDYDYLMRLWSSIRDLTLTSMAPALIYEEGNLIKRSIRDLYDRDTEEILVEGEAAYRATKDFMKLFIPSHAKRVKLYEDRQIQLFQRFRVERELEDMHRPVVDLKSGGSIVINPTEALVSIDVNSGRSTRERHIEGTALRTNLEACDEIARQLRLRDLAGLIVVDFIDMETPRNQTQVERRLKEATKNDRARIQIGRISSFGLLEMSRQRLRPSLIETSFERCAACEGTGVTRTTESMALAVLRQIEQQAADHQGGEILAKLPGTVALYLLNHKRRTLLTTEERFQVAIRVQADWSPAAHEFSVESVGGTRSAIAAAEPVEEGEATVVREVEAEGEEDEAGEAQKRSRKRRSRRRKRPEDETAPITAAGEVGTAEEDDDGEGEDTAEVEEPREEVRASEDEAAKPPRKRRRRGKRGGRRRPGHEPLPAGATEEGLSGAEGEAMTDAERSEPAAGRVDVAFDDDLEGEPEEPRESVVEAAWGSVHGRMTEDADTVSLAWEGDVPQSEQDAASSTETAAAETGVSGASASDPDSMLETRVSAVGSDGDGEIRDWEPGVLADGPPQAETDAPAEAPVVEASPKRRRAPRKQAAPPPESAALPEAVSTVAAEEETAASTVAVDDEEKGIAAAEEGSPDGTLEPAAERDSEGHEGGQSSFPPLSANPTPEAERSDGDRHEAQDGDTDLEKEDIRRTIVINVGEGAPDGDGPRRGWWQRIIG